MKKIIILALALAILSIGAAQAQDDSYLGSWTDIQVSNNFTDHWYGSFRAEYRSKDNLQSTDCWFLRPTLGYKFNSWLKFDVAYDYLQKPSSLNHRALFSLTGTLKQGGLSVSVRERYIYAYNQDAQSSSHVLRSQFKAQYQIPNSIFKPYLAVELFTWDRWEKTRHYAGTLINISNHHALDLFYMYYTFDGKPAEHVIGVGYNITL